MSEKIPSLLEIIYMLSHIDMNLLVWSQGPFKCGRLGAMLHHDGLMKPLQLC